MPRDRGLAPIFALVARARRRMRLQRGLERACTAAIWTTGLALLGVQFVLAGYTGPGVPCLIAAGTLFAAAVVHAVMAPLPDDVVAHTIDRACGLDDRLRTAIAFDRIPVVARGTLDDAVTQAFIGAAIVDGVRAVPRGDVVRAAPMREPKNARLAAVVVASAVALAGIPRVVRPDAEPPRPPQAAAIVPPDEVFDDPETGAGDRIDVGFELATIADLEALGRDGGREELVEMAKELSAFTCGFRDREVTKEQLLRRLAELEERVRPGLAAFPEPERALLEERLEDVREALVRLPDRTRELERRGGPRAIQHPTTPRVTEFLPSGPASFGELRAYEPPLPAANRLSRRDTINAAGSKGFAATPYRVIYAQYRRTIEETMHRQKIPASYRYVIERYFYKIHPR